MRSKDDVQSRSSGEVKPLSSGVEQQSMVLWSRGGVVKWSRGAQKILNFFAWALLLREQQSAVRPKCAVKPSSRGAGAMGGAVSSTSVLLRNIEVEEL